MRTILAAVIALGLLSSSLEAQPYGPAVLQIPASTRALGMADAFPVSGSDSDAIFYNLAMAQTIAGITAGGQRWGAGATMLTLSGGAEWWGGRVALGLLSLDYSAPVPIEGGADGDFDETILFDSGVQRSEAVVALGYTRRIKGIRLGAVAKAIEQRRFGERETTAALDVSGGHVFGFVALGLSVQNIGVSADFEAGGGVDSPLEATLAAAGTRSLPLGPLDVLPAVSLSWMVDGTIVPAAGVEIGYWPISGRTFIARFGVRDPGSDVAKPFTAGAGFAGDRISLDYAWVPFDEGSSHRIGIRWR
jgi:hypothetical protein